MHESETTEQAQIFPLTLFLLFFRQSQTNLSLGWDTPCTVTIVLLLGMWIFEQRTFINRAYLSFHTAMYLSTPDLPIHFVICAFALLVTDWV